MSVCCAGNSVEFMLRRRGSVFLEAWCGGFKVVILVMIKNVRL
jgi:hypothetical protein